MFRMSVVRFGLAIRAKGKLPAFQSRCCGSIGFNPEFFLLDCKDFRTKQSGELVREENPSTLEMRDRQEIHRIQMKSTFLSAANCSRVIEPGP
jgi:hypothetical protein